MDSRKIRIPFPDRKRGRVTYTVIKSPENTMSDNQAAAAWKVVAWFIAAIFAIFVVLMMLPDRAFAQPVPKPRPNIETSNARLAADAFLWALTNNKPKAVWEFVPDEKRVFLKNPGIALAAINKTYPYLSKMHWIRFESVKKTTVQYYGRAYKESPAEGNKVPIHIYIDMARDKAGAWKMMGARYAVETGRVS